MVDVRSLAPSGCCFDERQFMQTILSESLAKWQCVQTHDLFCTYLLVFCSGRRVVELDEPEDVEAEDDEDEPPPPPPSKPVNRTRLRPILGELRSDLKALSEAVCC